MGKKLRDTTGGSMEGVYLFRNMGSFETIFMDDTNQVTLHSMQPTRNLPNILRSSSARAYKNYKTFMLDKNDVSFVSCMKDANTSFDLNAALSADSERDGKYNKVGSPKSHHQRKQVHHPLDTRYDVPSWNNNNINKDKDALQTIDELGTLFVPLGHEEGTPTKKMSNKHNGQGRRRLFKKSTQAAMGKSSDKKTTKPPGFGTDSPVATDVNTTSDVTAQSRTFLHNFLGDDVSVDIVEAETKSDEWPGIFYRTNDVYKLEKRGNANCNSVVSGRSTECNAMQQDVALQKDPLSCELVAGENGFVGNPTSKNNRSNFLLASEVLCTCPCANCTICDQDFVLYEDSVPSCVNSDAEAELFTPYTYDFYTSDYYHVLGDIDGFDKIFSYEVAEATSVTKENDIGGCGAAKSIETNVSAPNANVPTPMKQCELKNSQTLCIDRAQDISVESSPVELVTVLNESTGASKAANQVRDLNEAGHLNLEGYSVETNETTSENQDIASTNVPALVPNNRPRKSRKDLCVIQCAQCNRLFSKKKFRRHFTHCTFYKEDFKCHVCSKVYRYKSSLVHHLKITHNISNNVYEKYYICNKCDKPYVRFRAFQRHLLVHNNW